MPVHDQCIRQTGKSKVQTNVILLRRSGEIHGVVILTVQVIEFSVRGQFPVRRLCSRIGALVGAVIRGGLCRLLRLFHLIVGEIIPERGGCLLGTEQSHIRNVCIVCPLDRREHIIPDSLEQALIKGIAAEIDQNILPIGGTLIGEVNGSRLRDGGLVRDKIQLSLKGRVCIQPHLDKQILVLVRLNGGAGQINKRIRIAGVRVRLEPGEGDAVLFHKRSGQRIAAADVGDPLVCVEP